MAEFEGYAPAGCGRRLAAFLGNFAAIGVLTTILDLLGVPDAVVTPILNLLCAILVVVFCVFPETPGRRLMNLQVITADKEKPSTKVRVIRTLPYLVFFYLGVIMPGTPPGSAADWVLVSIGGLTLLFAFADALAVCFSPDKLSLLDMKLGTMVATPPPLPENLRRTLFGMKIR